MIFTELMRNVGKKPLCNAHLCSLIWAFLFVDMYYSIHSFCKQTRKTRISHLGRLIRAANCICLHGEIRKISTLFGQKMHLICISVIAIFFRIDPIKKWSLSNSHTASVIVKCATYEKGLYAICEQQRPRWASTSMQTDQSLLCLSKYSVISIHSVGGLWKPWSDWTHMQAGLSLHCLHMAKEPFSCFVACIIHRIILPYSLQKWSLSYFIHI